MKPSSAKAKGRMLQQWVGQKISTVTGRPFGADEEIASREMGQSGTDIRLIGEAKRLFPFSVECKNQQSWSVHTWAAQARKNCTEEMPWLLFAKRNHMEPVVVMDARVFFRIIHVLIQAGLCSASTFRTFSRTKKPE